MLCRRGAPGAACSRCCTWSTPTPSGSSAIRGSTSWPSPARWPADAPCSASPPSASSASGLELGGCDPVYVRHDADLPHAIENIVDGAYFNSGQSCCGLQRIYVHESVHEPFTRGCIELIQQYRLGDPLDPETTLGPVVRTAAAEAIRAQVRASIEAGARARDRGARLPREPARHAVPGTAAAARCPGALAGHARGDLRAGRRRHEGALGR